MVLRNMSVTPLYDNQGSQRAKRHMVAISQGILDAMIAGSVICNFVISGSSCRTSLIDTKAVSRCAIAAAAAPRVTYGCLRSRCLQRHTLCCAYERWRQPVSISYALLPYGLES